MRMELAEGAAKLTSILNRLFAVSRYGVLSNRALSSNVGSFRWRYLPHARTTGLPHECRWLAQAPRARQIAYIRHDGPNLFVRENSARGRHSGRPQAVLDDPVELAVGVTLNFHGGERRHARCHCICKGNTGVLSIEAMADKAVMRKVPLTLRSIFGSYGQRICQMFA